MREKIPEYDQQFQSKQKCRKKCRNPMLRRVRPGFPRFPRGSPEVPPRFLPRSPVSGGGGRRQGGRSSIRRCWVAKASLLPGVLAVPPTPPSRYFLKVTLKNDALACISEHVCILKISNLEKNEFSLKSFILLVFWHFLGILGGSKNRQKAREIRKKITGRERRSSGTVFGAFLDNFLQFPRRKTL